MTAHVNVGIPHAGEGTHTLVIALELDDQALSDPGLEQRVLDRVAELIRPVLDERRSGPVADAFLATCGVTLDDMRAYDKSREITEIRHELMLLLRRHGWSYPRIGELLHRDHTTVMAGVRKAEQRARSRSCEECGEPALAGGRWCAGCLGEYAKSA